MGDSLCERRTPWSTSRWRSCSGPLETLRAWVNSTGGPAFNSRIGGGRMRLASTWFLPTVALLTACSGIPLKQRQDALSARYEAYAGAPVKQFTWIGHYDSWEPIGTNQLVVWTTPFQAYLIKVAPPCDNLQFVQPDRTDFHREYRFRTLRLREGGARLALPDPGDPPGRLPAHATGHAQGSACGRREASTVYPGSAPSGSPAPAA